MGAQELPVSEKVNAQEAILEYLTLAFGCKLSRTARKIWNQGEPLEITGKSVLRDIDELFDQDP